MRLIGMTHLGHATPQLADNQGLSTPLTRKYSLQILTVEACGGRMPSTRINIDALRNVRARLGDVIADPLVWVDLMEDTCRAVGASAAGLLQADARTPDVPITHGGKEVFGSYFRNGLHMCDLRAARAVPHLARGAQVLIDEDLVTPDDIKRDPMYANLIRCGFQWFGGVIFYANSALWCLSIQRTIKEGPFGQTDKRILASLSRPLTEAATLSTAIGRVGIAAATSALDAVRQPAIAVDRQGLVLEANIAANALFDDDIRIKNKRLCIADQCASKSITDFVGAMAVRSDDAGLAMKPVVVRRSGRSSVIIRVLPVPPAARSPFLGARALMTFTPVETKPGPAALLLEQIFGLTLAEARLASLMAEGMSPEAAAEELGIARETARNQLKAVFAKTATHRQSELVALLARI